ncbi:MAG: alpha/beta fold hydrolase [Thermoanaerobaculia bacterium]
MRSAPRALLVALVLFSSGVSAASVREPVAKVILQVASEQGAGAAIGTYLHLKKTAANQYDFSEPQLNAVGYRLLQNKRPSDAIAIFELNIQMFPRSANARDSLADAYARTGDIASARSEYKRALTMLDRGDAAPSKRSTTFLKANIRRQLERLRRYPIYEPLTGVYRTDDGRAISISIAEPNFGSTPPSLRFTELPSGRIRTLHERTELSYFAGPTIDDRSPLQFRVDFAPADSGLVSSLTVTEGGSVVRATRLPYPPAEKVVFRSGVVELEGTLSLPLAGGRHPAVILVHGSGKATRDAPGFGELANVLVLQGFAVLRYDKRGWGESTLGETAYPFLDDLARDAAAATRYLRSRGEIDPSRVGLLGFSEGAWVAGIAASHLPREVSFLVLLSGGGVTPPEQELYRVRAEMEAAGFVEQTIVEATEYMQLKFDVARTGAGWDQYTARARSLRRSPWIRYTGRWNSLEFAQAAWYQALGYSPSERLVHVEIPVLAILGVRDLLTPADETAAALRESFSGERASLLEIRKVPKANHLLLESASGAIRFQQSELPRLERYAPGYFDELSAWLARWCEERPQ